jgi:hypothetical protein
MDDRWFKNPQEFFIAPKEFECSLKQGLDMFDPIGYTQHLICETKSDWTAVFVSSGEIGLSVPCYSLNCRGLEVTLIEDTFDSKTNLGNHGCTRLSVVRDRNRPSVANSEERLLYTIKCEGGRGWKFGEFGSVMPFEEPENYSQPKVYNRFSPALLERYLNSFGIRMFDEDFFGPRMACFGYKMRSPECNEEKKTYLDYHVSRGLDYGRVKVQ